MTNVSNPNQASHQVIHILSIDVIYPICSNMHRRVFIPLLITSKLSLNPNKPKLGKYDTIDSTKKNQK